MTLADLITTFQKESGRLDITTDSTPNVYHYLNAGIRWLDSHFPTPKTAAWYKKDIAAGDYKLKFQYCRAVREVWLTDSADGDVPLERKSLGWMMEEYKDILTDIDQAQPSYWCTIPIGLSPEQQALTSSNYTNEFTYRSFPITFSDEAAHYGYQGIWFMAPADETYTISVLADFFTIELSGSVTANYWTTVYPEAVKLAALMMVEMGYRNYSGQTALEQGIRSIVFGVQADQVTEEMSGDAVMEG